MVTNRTTSDVSYEGTWTTVHGFTGYLSETPWQKIPSIDMKKLKYTTTMLLRLKTFNKHRSFFD
jgi:hypothetical protein